MTRRTRPTPRGACPDFRGPIAPLLAALALVSFASLPQPLSWLALPVALIVPGHLVLLTFGVTDHSNIVSRAALAAIVSLGAYPLIALASFAITMEFNRSMLIVGVLTLGLTAAGRELFSKRVESTKVERDVLRDRHRRSSSWLTALVCVTIGLLIVAAGPRLIPPPRPAPFVTLELSGTWAFVDRTLKPPSGPFKVDVKIGNKTAAHIFGRLLVTIDGQTLTDHTELSVEAGAETIEVVDLPSLAGGCVHHVTISVKLSPPASTFGTKNSSLPDVTPRPLQFFFGQDAASQPC
ncbi:MAG: hypothetical protein KDC08_01330 [Actinobacteria bacterium]|nr:hypothetical protein [Actinomycetota bacterium]